MIEIFQYSFMQRAFLAGIIIGIIAPVIGIFLIVRRYSLFADTLAHVSLLGVAVGLFTRTQPVAAAIVASLLGAVGIEGLRTRVKFFSESLLALFLSGSLAIAAVLMSLGQGFNVNLLNFLFGSITTVQQTDIYFIGGLGVVALFIVILLYNKLLLVSFDEEAARVGGLPAGKINLVIMVLAALTVALSIRIVGVLLVGALMVIPNITAMLYGRGFKTTMLIAMGFSLASVLIGLFVSFYFGIASGGAIVTTALLFFIASLLSRKVRS